MFIKILATIKKCLILVIIQPSQNIMIIQTNQLIQTNFIVDRMKDKIAGAVIQEFVESKCRMSAFMVDDSSKHKKNKGAK